MAHPYVKHLRPNDRYRRSERTKDGNPNDYGDLPMFIKRARTSDPHTSKEAAKRADALADRHTGMIYAVLKANDPLNFEEIAIMLQADSSEFANTSKVSRRMVDLERLGLAERTGATRATSSGRQAQLWRALLCT